MKLPLLIIWRTSVLALAAMLSASHTLAAVLFTDNFNIPDTSSLDGSSQTGRHTGILVDDLVLRSGGTQMAISSQQVDFFKAGTASGRIRFQNASALPTDAMWNFAFGAGGTQILQDQGFRFAFDWTPSNNTDDNWISLSVGINNLDLRFRVNDANTDFGILFRNTGGTQLFDNAVPTTGPNFDVAAVTPHHAQVDFAFNSFADGSDVIATTMLDGVPLGSPTLFQWDGDFGVLNLELGNFAAGTRLDNVSITTVPEPEASGLFGLGSMAVGLRRRRARREDTGEGAHRHRQLERSGVSTRRVS